MPLLNSHLKIMAMAACALLTFSEAQAQSNTAVNTSVRHSSNSGIVYGDDVIVNGPVVRGGNSSHTAIRTGVNTNAGNVSSGDGVLDVGNGAVRISNGNVSVGNGVYINSDVPYYRSKARARGVSRYNKGRVVSRNAGQGVNKSTYREGNCIVERKQVGGMVKEDIRCP